MIEEDFEDLDRNNRIGAVILFTFATLVILTLITIFI
jgi:hypothetical protein